MPKHLYRRPTEVHFTVSPSRLRWVLPTSRFIQTTQSSKEMPEKKNIIMLKNIVFSHFVIYQQMKLFINQIKHPKTPNKQLNDQHDVTEKQNSKKY